MFCIRVQYRYLEEDDFVVRASRVLLINCPVGHFPGNCWGSEYEVQD
jgi:hypothetical protein